MSPPVAPWRIRAFSVVELLTAVAVIGLLAVMLTPAFKSAAGGAKQAKCAQNMRSFLQALPLYAADHDGRLPKSVFVANDASVEVRLALSSYMGSPDGMTTAQLFQWTKRFLCTDTNWGYGFNSFVSEMPLAAISAPSRLIYLMENSPGSRWIRNATLSGNPQDLRERVPKPHNRKVNAGFLDGHVEPAFVSKLTWDQFTRDTSAWSQSHENRTFAKPSYDQ